MSWATWMRWSSTLTEGTDKMMSVFLLAKVESDEGVIVVSVLQLGGEGDAGNGQKFLH